jgi:CheY-like chemotaxis protein
VVRVLLVDDSREVLEVLELVYSFHPSIAVVGTALNNVEALDFLKHNLVDVISIDINMGKYNGFDLCRTVRRTMPHVFITMCSAVASDENQRIAQSLGAHYFLQKPVGIDDIQQLIDAYYAWRNKHRLVSAK